MTTTTTLTYTEHASTMSRTARQSACTEAGKLWLKATAAATSIGELEIDCVNRLREAGLKINQACGREQLSFNLEGKEFCRREILPLLPAGMDLAAVHTCVHLANHLKQPVATREELRAIKPELQLAFQTLGLVEAPRRKELQTAHGRNLFSDFVSRTLGLRALFEELEKEEPMETWPAPKLDEFLESTLPVKERIERAERLRLGRT